MPKTRTAIPNRREARVIVTSEDLLSVYMQYCCQRNSFCTVNYSAIVLNCLGRFLALSPSPDRGCGETSGGKGGKVVTMTNLTALAPPQLKIMKSSPHRGNTALGGVQSFAGWHALHGVGLWQALFGWPPFLTSDNEYYVNYRGENILDASEVKWDDKPTEASEPMTLCIAASFYNPVEELPGIVLCCDERGTRGLVSADDSDKVRWSPDERMAVLLAGSRTAADQLYLAIMEAIEGQADLSDEIKITRLIQLVKRAAQKRKRELMDEHVSLTLGMSLEEFTSKSRSVLLETHYLEVWHDLKTITLGAELILAALAGQEAILLRVTPSGDVLWEKHL